MGQYVCSACGQPQPCDARWLCWGCGERLWLVARWRERSAYIGCPESGAKRMTSRALLAELCALFHAKPNAMLCALNHGQVSIDGYVIREKHLERWTPDQLRGRYVTLVGRQARLYG